MARKLEIVVMPDGQMKLSGGKWSIQELTNIAQGIMKFVQDIGIDFDAPKLPERGQTGEEKDKKVE